MGEHMDPEYAVCPYCGAQHGDCWEWNNQESWQDVECEDCQQTFESCAAYDVQYLSRPKKERLRKKGRKNV